MSAAIAKSVRLSLIGSAVISALSASPVFAQEEASVEESANLERMIITSRKKTESVIEVPMNVSSVGALEIADRNLLVKEDLFRSIAGAANPRGELILRGLSGSNTSTQ